jgi:hypothetical protein
VGAQPGGLGYPAGGPSILALAQFLMADKGALRRYRERPAVRMGSLLAVVSTLGWLGYVAWAWRDQHPDRWARAHDLGIALAASAFALLLLYWNLPW